MGSIYTTYYITSMRYKLEIEVLKSGLISAEANLARERLLKQENLSVDINTLLNQLNTSIKDSNLKAAKLKESLKGVVLVTKDCNPSQDFINTWNASSSSVQ